MCYLCMTLMIRHLFMKIEIGMAVGANLASLPIVCSGYWQSSTGYHTSDKCFSYVEGEWQHFATMIRKRAGAAGIVYNNGFHIFGGYEEIWKSNTILQSSEIVKKDGSSTEGPQLPANISSHAIASINSTVSIITGGYTNAAYPNNYVDKTWYFNHATQEFQPGPNMLEARSGHASGTITDQESKEKMVIIAGGESSAWPPGLRDSTDILLNGQWVTGR